MSVTFELNRLEWTPDGRVEVEGRWFGIRGRRILRPVLEVEAGGRRHRLLALLEHKPWEATDGEEWLAAFPWEGKPVDPVAAELAVGPDLSVNLISPPATRKDGGRRPQRRKPKRPSAEQLGRELAAARAEAHRLRGELEEARAAYAAEAQRLGASLTVERESTRRLTEELEAARAAIAGRAEAERLAGELRGERDEAVAERDAVVRGRSALERERDEAARACQKARRERNEWLSRARTLAAQRDAARAELDATRERDAVPPASASLTPEPALEETGSRKWAPRLVAVIALIVLIAVVAGLIAWAS